MAPGLRRMETPAMLCETGNSATVASLAEPASPTQPRSASRSNLKVGSGSNLVSSGAGVGSGAAALAVLAAASPSDAKPTASKTDLRVIPDMGVNLPPQRL